MIKFIKITKKAICSVFSLFVINAREKRHWTQKKLAEQLYVSVRWLQSLEKGSKIPSLYLAVNLIVLLEIDPAELFCAIVEKMREEAGEDVSLSRS